ncbi:sensor histidine kinase [Nitratireductor sp. GCM10026969]|uniref:sensor histidine kinase n=1 Tax=Nitratireductor sp. GCM10026969 TaxID=3252645 RepID=UPI00362325D9
MALERTYTADKFIIDRRKPHRNSEVAQAVRRTRERLSQTSGNPNFDREMLKLHSRTIISAMPAILLVVILISGGGAMLGLARETATWALLTAAGYGGLYLFARHVAAKPMRRASDHPPRLAFLALHFLSGVGWTYLVLVDCTDCAMSNMPVLVATMLLAALAATAILTSSLRGALVASFTLPVILYAAIHFKPQLAVEPIMAVLLLLSLAFLAHLARHRYHAAVMLLSFRSEKDALVAELETAKALSDEARRRAEEANLAKSRFLASMSHELRTPLNAILGFSEVMAKEVLGPIRNETYRDYARDVHESGRHLLDLINEILDLSRIESGRYQMNEEPLALADLVQECCRMMELKVRTKDIHLFQQAEPVLPRLLADHRAVRQIVLNLLSNAIKFTPSGGEIRVRVGWTAGGGQYIAVKDNGPGIAEDEIPIVLAAFGQGSIAIKSAEQGTGLGLPIVQGLAKLHDARFDLRSKLREGTEAIVAFPPARVLEEAPANPRQVALRKAG